jgi:hypothetical protein
MADWVGWHARYDDPASTQSRRLVVVRRRVGEALDGPGVASRRILGLCAGDGRDLLPELAARPGLEPAVLLVERDEALAARARASAAALGVEGVEVRAADAARPASFADVLPVDLLLLCGIFGNVGNEDVHSTVSAVPLLLAPGGVVIWTRGRLDGPDLRPTVRAWVRGAGLTEVAYDEEPEGYGVGVARAGADVPREGTLPDPLFTFVR